jgi:hypothetical protein
MEIAIKKYFLMDEEEYYNGYDFYTGLTTTEFIFPLAEEYNLDDLYDLNDYFSHIGIPHYYYRPNKFYNDNGINVAKLKRLFVKTDYESFTNYLIYIAWEFNCLLNEEKKKDLSLEVEFENAKMLKYLRNNISKKHTLSLSFKPKERVKSTNPELIKVIKDYLERQFATIVKKEDNEIIYYNIHDAFLNKKIKQNSTQTKKLGAPSKNRKLDELVEILLYVGSLKKANGENPHTFNDYSSANFHLIFDYLIVTGILNKIFSSQGKSVDSLKSTPYDYIRSLINNLRHKRSK